MASKIWRNRRVIELVGDNGGDLFEGEQVSPLETLSTEGVGRRCPTILSDKSLDCILDDIERDPRLFAACECEKTGTVLDATGETVRFAR
jgi:hypothetical protein